MCTDDDGIVLDSGAAGHQEQTHPQYHCTDPRQRTHTFAEDPNVRAFADGLNLLLLNAVLLTAGR